MKAVIQRVDRACVRVDGETVGECGRGFLILLGVAEGDTEAEADLLCRKTVGLRVFPDEAGKMNRSLSDIGGAALYEYFTAQVKKTVSHVDSGVFGAHMEVSLLNNGPVTILLDTEELKKK